MWAYYNEFDPNAAQWLRELIKLKLIAPGDVDERSIEDVTPKDLEGYTQCHFFAGIGVWSHALRQAGWSDDRQVWTGSCPCQPFSSAGQRLGFDDKRHLWPSFHYLIQQCRPDVVIGEQVAGKSGEAWLDLVQDDLAGIGYGCVSATTAACGFGAPHQRKRLYWVADSQSQRWHGGEGAAGKNRRTGLEVGSTSGGVADPSIKGPQGGLRGRQDSEREDQCRHLGRSSADNRPNATNGFWANVDWLGCRDGKWRPIKPGAFPLVDGSPSELVPGRHLSIEDVEETKEARVMRLKGYGNAIVAQQAQGFIEAYMEAVQCH